MKRIEIVIDTSAVLAVLVNEPSRESILERTRGATVVSAPSLPWEVGNALVALVRRRFATGQQIQRAWVAFLRIPIRYADVDVPAALRLAEAQGLYAYDAYVLEVARKTGLALLSLDRRQRTAARASGIMTLEVEA